MDRNRRLLAGVSRRQLMKAGLALTAARAASPAIAAANTSPLTPACAADLGLTRAQTAGPFFTPQTPLKNDFRQDGSGGPEMTLSGFVTDQVCRPQTAVHMELWHAGPDGRYDNQGFLFRGHLLTDERGRYQFITLQPGLYPGRTRHFHVTLRPSHGPALTTQLYFPGEAGNRTDGIFDEKLTLDVSGSGPLNARFDFVIRG